MRESALSKRLWPFIGEAARLVLDLGRFFATRSFFLARLIPVRTFAFGADSRLLVFVAWQPFMAATLAPESL